MITIRPSHSRDPGDLAPWLRAADIAELQAACGASPLEGLESAYKVSEVCMTAELEGEIIAMFGVARDDEVSEEIGVAYGNVWFLGSPESVSNAKFFMRESRAWLAEMDRKYDALGNAVDARNVKHVRWIKAMGFTFVDTIHDYGEQGETFLRFYKTCEGPACVLPN